MQIEQMNSVNDTELLLQLSDGSVRAFDILYAKYWKKVFNAAYKRVNDKEIAEDIAQDIFVQLWIRGSESLIVDLQAYLFVATRNGVFKRARKESKYENLPQNLEDVRHQSGSSDADVLHKEFLRSFENLVGKLPEQQRIIFQLRFNENLSSLEIADQLKLSPKTVRNHMGKALSTLRTELFLLEILLFLMHKN